jgi:hypothetical protein
VFLGFSWKHTHFWETFTNFHILQKYITEWIVPEFTGEFHLRDRTQVTFFPTDNGRHRYHTPTLSLKLIT